MRFVCDICGHEVDYDGDSSDMLRCGICNKGAMLIKNTKSLSLKCENCDRVFTYYGSEAMCMMKVHEYFHKLGILRKHKQPKKKKDVLKIRLDGIDCCENPHLIPRYWK